jgi:hypothetical protein
VAERFKAHAWKACVGLPLPRVRIPPSPPPGYPGGKRSVSISETIGVALFTIVD